jgi:hypothetical protein
MVIVLSFYLTRMALHSAACSPRMKPDTAPTFLTTYSFYVIKPISINDSKPSDTILTIGSNDIRLSFMRKIRKSTWPTTL